MIGDIRHFQQSIRLSLLVFKMILVYSVICPRALALLQCSSNPCEVFNHTCCPTYPCEDVQIPAGKSILEIASFTALFNDKGMAAVRIAVDKINNDSSIFPDSIVRARFAAATPSKVSGTSSFVCASLWPDFSLANKHNVSLFVGDTFSFTTSSFGHIAHIMDVPIISPTATSPIFSDKTTFGTFSRVFPPDNKQGKAIAHLVKGFGWSLVAAISSSDEYGSALMDEFSSASKSLGIEVIHAMQFNPRLSAKPQLERIRDSGARIIIAFLLDGDAQNVFKAARDLGMVSTKYVWIGGDSMADFTDPIMPDGFLATSGFVNTSSAEYYEYKNDWVAAYEASNRCSHCEFQDPTGYTNVVGLYTYDATILGIKALYAAAKKPDYGGIANVTNVLESIRGLTMPGVTGTIAMDEKGDRIGAYSVRNARVEGDTIEWTTVALAFPTAPIEMLEGADIHWFGSRTTVPVDRPVLVTEFNQPTSGLRGFITALASIGLLISLGMLAFNIRYRNNTFIQMSTPTMNNVIVVGCMLAYLTMIVMATVDASAASDSSFAAHCGASVMLLAISFSLAYGGLFAKTYRVHIYFSSKTTRSVTINIWHLLMAVATLVLLDVAVATFWFVTDPLTRMDLRSPAVPFAGAEDDKELILIKSTCSSDNYLTFAAIFGVYKGLLALFGGFLAFLVRNVQIPALNDSRLVAASTFTVTLISVIIAPILWFIVDPVARFVISSLSIWFSATITLVILFVPKIFAVVSGQSEIMTNATFTVNTGGNTSTHQGSGHNTASIASGTGKQAKKHGSIGVINVIPVGTSSRGGRAESANNLLNGSSRHRGSDEIA